MVDTTALKPITFGNIVSICQNRANMLPPVQARDTNFIKGAINQWNQTISTERRWYWRRFDRSFVFDVAITTGTVAVTEDSRVATFTGLTLDNTHVGRSILIDGDQDMYRIIGYDSGANEAYLETTYVGTTNATATFKMFQYEFPLPPDCDTINQLYYDSSYSYYNNSENELRAYDPNKFNRMIASNLDYAGPPYAYTREGEISIENLPPLDEMVLDYDFLGGDEFDKVSRVRISPIQPDKKRVIHLNYNRQVEDLQADGDTPLMPVDNRWVLVHFAMSEWWAKNGSGTMADREMAKGKMILKEMRAENNKTDSSPKFIIDKSKFGRHHFISQKKDDLFYVSRQSES